MLQNIYKCFLGFTFLYFSYIIFVETLVGPNLNFVLNLIRIENVGVIISSLSLSLSLVYFYCCYLNTPHSTPTHLSFLSGLYSFTFFTFYSECLLLSSKYFSTWFCTPIPLGNAFMTTTCQWKLTCCNVYFVLRLPVKNAVLIFVFSMFM